MTRVYGEPAEVWTRDGRPVRFVWRERLYAVLQIHEHWVTTREWWRRAGAEPGEAVEPDPSDAVEREVWRVEAGAGRGTVPGMYELCRDAASQTWLLSRIWD